MRLHAAVVHTHDEGINNFAVRGFGERMWIRRCFAQTREKISPPVRTSSRTLLLHSESYKLEFISSMDCKRNRLLVWIWGGDTIEETKLVRKLGEYLLQLLNMT